MRKQQQLSSERVPCSGTYQMSLFHLFMASENMAIMQSSSADFWIVDGLYTLSHLQQHEPALDGEQQPWCRLPTLQSLWQP